MSTALELLFRSAQESDLPQLYACDPYSQDHEARRVELRRMVQQGSCIAAANDRVLGFAVLEYNFFNCGFIPLICVSTEHRGKGIGLSLLMELGQRCLTPKLFTSTNASNASAQRLFTRAGFIRSGVVENIDQGDPEYIFFKEVRK